MIELRQESLPCSIAVENVWGPQVHGCGHDFDLTLFFQEVVLFAGPLAVLVLLATIRLWQLIRHDVVVASPVLHGLKLVRITVIYVTPIVTCFISLYLSIPTNVD